MNFATSSEKRSEKPGQELVITTEEENSQRVTVTSTCRNYRYYRVRNIQQLSQCLRREKLPQHWAELAKCVMMGKWQWHCHRPIDCWQNSWVLLQNKCKLLSWMFYFFKNYYWISVKLGGSWIEEELTRLWDLRPSLFTFNAFLLFPPTPFPSSAVYPYFPSYSLRVKDVVTYHWPLAEVCILMTVLSPYPW